MADDDQRARLVLDGPWKIASGDGETRRGFHEPDFDDSGWDTIEIPGVWQAHERFRDEPGPMLLRRRITLPTLTPGRRWWLELDGVYYSCDVWLNGQLLGSTVGYFMSHRFDITDVASAGETVLALDISAPTAGPEDTTNSLTGIYTDPDVMGATWNPGGVWRGVTVVQSGGVRIQRLRAICLAAAPDLATVGITAQIDAQAATPVSITTRVNPQGSSVVALDERRDHHLASGPNELHWVVEITNPDLWWPAGLGDQPLYDLYVEVEASSSDPKLAPIASTATRRIGLRTVHTDRFITTINGVRRFLKGATLWPLDADPSQANLATAKACLDHAKQLGLDLLRVHAHVASPELYAAADELGVLLWQDLPLRGPTTRAIEAQARHQARVLVDELGHHPSIITWCAHDDPSGTVSNPSDSTVSAALQLARRYLPGWNTASLDRSLAHTLRTLDPSRQVLANSGLPPGAASPTDNDTVAWFGWRKGTGRDLAAFMRRHPRRVQWLSTFGAQSFPDDDGFVESDRWPDLHWGELAGAYGLDIEALDRYVPRSDYADYRSYQQATQDYQATVVRRQIEQLRRNKYAPTGGFTFWTLIDTRPSVSFAVVDAAGNPKTAFGAIAEACQPVIVVSDRLDPDLSPTAPVAVTIEVVNDHLYGWEQATVTATLFWTGGHHTYRFRRPVAPDSVTAMGMLSWVAPDSPGPVRLVLTLENPDGGSPLATNSYASRITRT